jgi:hypothetical protein
MFLPQCEKPSFTPIQNVVITVLYNCNTTLYIQHARAVIMSSPGDLQRMNSLYGSAVCKTNHMSVCRRGTGSWVCFISSRCPHLRILANGE